MKRNAHFEWIASHSPYVSASARRRSRLASLRAGRKTPAQRVSQRSPYFPHGGLSPEDCLQGLVLGRSHELGQSVELNFSSRFERKWYRVLQYPRDRPLCSPILPGDVLRTQRRGEECIGCLLVRLGHSYLGRGGGTSRRARAAAQSSASMRPEQSESTRPTRSAFSPAYMRSVVMNSKTV